MIIYDLRPEEFAGKARVILTGRTKILLSFGIPVARQKGKHITRLWNGYSNITGRHVKAFCGLDKTEFLALPCREKTDKTALTYLQAMFTAERKEK